MRKIVFSIVFISSAMVLALNSEMEFTTSELKVSSLVARQSGQDDDQLSTVAVRILQLQLQSSGCHRPMVNQMQMNKSIIYKYTVSDDDCVVKRKSADCDAGFGARDMQPNKFKPDDEIIGIEKYKVCVKGAASGTGSAPTRATPAKPEGR